MRVPAVVAFCRREQLGDAASFWLCGSVRVWVIDVGLIVAAVADVGRKIDGGRRIGVVAGEHVTDAVVVVSAAANERESGRTNARATTGTEQSAPGKASPL
jgi:hypothetical protein